MSVEQNTRLVQDAYAAYQRGDIASVLNLLTDDITWSLPGPQEIIPFLGQRQGRDQVRQFFSLLGDSSEAEQFDVQQLIAQGDQVVALGHSRWKVKATGRRFEGDFAHVFTIRNGKVSGFQEYIDTYPAVMAFTSTQAAAR